MSQTIEESNNSNNFSDSQSQIVDNASSSQHRPKISQVSAKNMNKDMRKDNTNQQTHNFDQFKSFKKRKQERYMNGL